MSRTKVQFLLGTAFLLIMHGVGLWGMLFSKAPQEFARLTPVNLLVCAAVLAAFHRPWNRNFVLFTGLVFLLGFGVEVLGVHTGWPFGDYRYGQALGVKLAEVPLLIGLNWLLLTYCSGVVVSRLAVPKWLRVLLAALLMVGMDFLIEPVAVKYDYWSWHQNEIPAGNYLGWFGVAILQQLFFQQFAAASINKLAGVLLVVQIVFFLVLVTFL